LSGLLPFKDGEKIIKECEKCKNKSVFTASKPYANGDQFATCDICGKLLQVEGKPKK